MARPASISAFLIAVSLLGSQSSSAQDKNPFVVVLGIAQDAGYPHAGCKRECCKEAWDDPSRKRMVSCLALVDPVSNERWLFDATPDATSQLHLLDDIHPATQKRVDYTTPLSATLGISGIFLTHAHIGHYTGLMYLGREGIGAKDVPVYAMSRMAQFLSSNGPWSQLVQLDNIAIKQLADQTSVQLNERISVTPFLVPHRDEFSETVGFLVKGPTKSFIYIPDIDKWERWTTRIEEMIARVDYAFLDGTFFAEGEIPGRNMSEIPHPFIVESMERFAALSQSEKAKVYFIHLNHTNRALKNESDARKEITARGFHVAEEGMRVGL